MARIQKVSHVVLNVSDPAASAEWYSDVLGMEVMSSMESMGMVFLSFGTQDHDIALIKGPRS
jgi:catechol 2,3-dioxygenase-like lactoylglutathione lyase family enzyme